MDMSGVGPERGALAGRSQRVRAVMPQGWQGDLDCVIGPFASRRCALVFVASRVDFGRGDVLERVFPRGGEWFVELSRLAL